MYGTQTEKDIAKVAGSAVAAGAPSALAAAGVTSSAPAATAAVTGLLSAAGASSAVPFAGWIAAGGLALAAGTIATVSAIHSGRLRRQEAVAYARAHGLPEPEKVPAFVVHALHKTPSWRAREAAKLQRQLGNRGLRHLGRSDTKIRAKLAILGAVEGTARAEARGNLPPPPPPGMLAAEHGSTWGPASSSSSVLLGGAVLLLFIAIALKRRRKAENT